MLSLSSVSLIHWHISSRALQVSATRLGGTDTIQGSNIQQQQVIGLTADLATNNIYATGYTFDHGFPIPASGYQHTCPNYDATKDTYDYCNSAYVIELNSSLTSIQGGSFLVGPNFRSSGSTGYNVRLDSKKQVYLYGISNDGGGDFPQVNALQGYKGGNQLFISTFSADMSKLLFSTRFGNTASNNSSVKPAGGLVLDSNDNIYFAGTTNDTVLRALPAPTTPPLRPARVTTRFSLS